jgi:secreted trypsin-like serine protease
VRTRLLVALAAALCFVGLSTPADAITNGQPDNGAHPYVGLVVFYDASGTPTHRCSGTMISRRTLLTAGHCTCFGDSGGPIFTAGTSTIVAVTSFGLNENCAGGGFGYRVDTAGAAAFIGQYL